MTKPDPEDVLDTIYDETGQVELERGKHSREQMRWAKGVVATLRERIAEKRRALVPDQVSRTKAKPISDAARALDRDGLIAKLTEFARRGPNVQFAFRNLKGLSDDDLRRILDLLEG